MDMANGSAQSSLYRPGSPLYRDHVPARDSAQVALVRAAGAIVTAKRLGSTGNARD